MRTFTIDKRGDSGKRSSTHSIKIYGRQDWWWLLMKYNGIDDVWNELYVGMIISVPDRRDINNYVTRYTYVD